MKTYTSIWLCFYLFPSSHFSVLFWFAAICFAWLVLSHLEPHEFNLQLLIWKVQRNKVLFFLESFVYMYISLEGKDGKTTHWLYTNYCLHHLYSNYTSVVFLSLLIGFQKYSLCFTIIDFLPSLKCVAPSNHRILKLKEANSKIEENN